jgi:RNA polymerase sigma-70 factor (ECF subfamily)
LWTIDLGVQLVLMEPAMGSESGETEALIRRVERGDDRALAELFARYRGRLRRMIKLRLDRRLQGRFDPSDVLQEAFLDVARRSREYLENPAMPVFLWLRWITGEKLLALHRKHLGAQMRDAGLEVSLHRGSMPQASSISLAAMLLGQLTSPTHAARRAEMQVRLQEVLNALDPVDREVLTLRHFEELSNGEIAQVLGISKSAASNRYIRALLRVKETLSDMPGFFDD